MIGVRPTRVLLAVVSALAIVPAAAAAQDQTAPPPPAPVIHKHIGQVKYEDVATSGDTSDTATADAASGNTSGKRMHKPYTIGATADVPVIQVQSISWGKLEGTGPVYSADPMEGGQIAARTYRPGRQKPGKIGLTNVTSDPEEGGQVSAARADVSAVPLTADQPPPVAGTGGTSAKVKATFKTLAGACVKGEHLKTALITAREGSYTLHDVTVTDVTPAGDGMEAVSVSFASRDE